MADQGNDGSNDVWKVPVEKGKVTGERQKPTPPPKPPKQ